MFKNEGGRVKGRLNNVKKKQTIWYWRASLTFLRSSALQCTAIVVNNLKRKEFGVTKTFCAKQDSLFMVSLKGMKTEAAAVKEMARQDGIQQ